MDDSIVFQKTAAGEAAIRDRARLAQQNLRNVLIVVDGVTDVSALQRKIGDPAMTEAALLELELLGFIAPVAAGPAPQPGESAGDAPGGTDTRGAERNPQPGEPAAGERCSPGVSEDEGAAVAAPIEGPHLQPDTDDEAIYEQAYGLEDPAPESTVGGTRKSGRRPLSRTTRRRLGALLAMALLAALVLAVFRIVLYPYDAYRPDAESALSRAIGDTARVGALRVSFLPIPVVILEKVSLGDTPHASIDAVRLVAEPSSILHGGLRFSEVRLEGVRIGHTGVSAASGWLSRADLTTLGARSLSIDGLSLMVGDIAIGKLAGRAEARQDRGIETLVLRSPDGGLRLEATPAANGVSLSVSARRWTLPIMPAIAFSVLDASATLSDDGLRIASFDGAALNGRISGSGTIAWNDGARADLSITLQNVDARGLLEAWGAPAAFEGTMSGSITSTSRTSRADELAEHPRLSGLIQSSRGSLPGIDLADALRGGTGRADAPVRGGRTDFEQFTAAISVDERRVRIFNARLDSGRLKATGQADINRQTGVIAGIATVGLHSSSGERYSTVTLSGTAAAPELRAR